MDWYGDFQLVREKLTAKGWQPTNVSGVLLSQHRVELWMKFDAQGFPTAEIFVMMNQSDVKIFTQNVSVEKGVLED